LRRRTLLVRTPQELQSKRAEHAGAKIFVLGRERRLAQGGELRRNRGCILHRFVKSVYYIQLYTVYNLYDEIVLLRC